MEPNSFPIDASEKAKSAKEEFEAVFAERLSYQQSMQQSKVLPMDGFIDMQKEPHIWALAYPQAISASFDQWEVLYPG
jgi:hypothetical protein